MQTAEPENDLWVLFHIWIWYLFHKSDTNFRKRKISDEPEADEPEIKKKRVLDSDDSDAEESKPTDSEPIVDKISDEKVDEDPKSPEDENRPESREEEPGEETMENLNSDNESENIEKKRALDSDSDSDDVEAALKEIDEEEKGLIDQGEDSNESKKDPQPTDDVKEFSSSSESENQGTEYALDRNLTLIFSTR